MIKPKTCPFCGSMPGLHPKDPQREGTAFGEVRCENSKCPAKPRVNDGELVADDRGTAAYQEAAIRRWNKRF